MANSDYRYYPAIDSSNNFAPAVRAALAAAIEFTGPYATKTALAAKADLVGGVVPTSQLPAISLTTAVPVASRAAMLALTTAQVQPGDIAIDSSAATRGSYILLGNDPTVLSNWALLNAPTDVVSSVNSQTGAVVLGKTDVGLANVDNVSDVNKPISTATQTALDNKASILENIYAATASAASFSVAEPTQSAVNDITLAVATTALVFPSFPAAGKSKTFMLVLRQDATGGRTVTWPSSVKWPGGFAPVLTGTGTKIDIVTCTCIDGVSWLGFPGGLNF